MKSKSSIVMSDVHATPIAWQYVCYSLPILLPMSVYVIKKCFANKYRALNSKVNPNIIDLYWLLLFNWLEVCVFTTVVWPEISSMMLNFVRHTKVVFLNWIQSKTIFIMFSFFVTTSYWTVTFSSSLLFH